MSLFLPTVASYTLWDKKFKQLFINIRHDMKNIHINKNAYIILLFEHSMMTVDVLQQRIESILNALNVLVKSSSDINIGLITFHDEVTHTIDVKPLKENINSITSVLKDLKAQSWRNIKPALNQLYSMIDKILITSDSQTETMPYVSVLALSEVVPKAGCNNVATNEELTTFLKMFIHYYHTRLCITWHWFVMYEDIVLYNTIKKIAPYHSSVLHYIAPSLTRCSSLNHPTSSSDTLCDYISFIIETIITIQYCNVSCYYLDENNQKYIMYLPCLVPNHQIRLFMKNTSPTIKSVHLEAIDLQNKINKTVQPIIPLQILEATDERKSFDLYNMHTCFTSLYKLLSCDDKTDTGREANLFYMLLKRILIRLEQSKSNNDRFIVFLEYVLQKMKRYTETLPLTLLHYLHLYGYDILWPSPPKYKLSQFS
jgi:hypothetical protein